MPGFVASRIPCRAVAALALLSLPCAFAKPAGQRGENTRETVSACPSAGTENAQVAKIDDGLDLTLTDGRSLHLAGLDPPRPGPAPDVVLKARDALATYVAAGIGFMPLAATPDRWGRIPAFVFAPKVTELAPGSAGEWLLAQGFARYMPAPEAHACRAVFLAAEATARQAERGLWHKPYYAVITATNRAAFAGKSASDVIVEGRLAGVTSTGYRTTLEFAPPREHAFSVTILQRNVAIFERSGLNFHALIGDMLRIRGLLDLRFGPRIEVASADAIEVIADEQMQGGSGRQSETSATPSPTKGP